MDLGKEIIEVLKEALEDPSTVKTVFGKNVKIETEDTFKEANLTCDQVFIDLGNN